MAKGSIEWEHSREDGLILKIKPGLGELFNDETRRHARAIRKEMLLACRSLIDIVVKQIEEKEAGTAKQGTKIEVE